jgi:hypothetical protein
LPVPWQSLSAAHAVLQVGTMAQMKPPAQPIALPALHEPIPSQEDEVSWPPLHDGVPHGVPARGFLHPPLPSQVPSLPQVVEMEHCPAGAASPTLMLPHVPSG